MILKIRLLMSKMNPNRKTGNEWNCDYLLADKRKNKGNELMMGKWVMDEWSKWDKVWENGSEVTQGHLRIKIC
jgi:hypothetical protein